MTEKSFEQALSERVDHILDACTACGKCVEVCPITVPAKMADADPKAVIAGVLDILRTGAGPEASRAWARSCVLSGECIDACGDGVNPRFMLAMARVALARQSKSIGDRRRQGVEQFRAVADGANVLARMQLTEDELVRLGQTVTTRLQDGATARAGERPDFVFYTGCNVLKTPHIALLALDIMDALGITYRVMGGPTHCCGVGQMRAGDTETSGRVATATVDKLAEGKAGVLAWCSSCFQQFTETTLPTVEKMRGARPFEMTPFMRFLGERLEDLRPKLRHRVTLRIALHKHPGAKGVMEAGEKILRAVPGIEIVDLGQPAVGLMSNALNALPDYKRELQRRELDAAEAAGVDALVATYHVDHRELCAHERDRPFRILNILEIVGASMGIAEQDHFKRLKIMQDADAVVADCAALIATHKLDPAKARAVVVKAMLGEQPLPLRDQPRRSGEDGLVTSPA
ncbi:MAG TPA: (Fe-S)-binding protein [Pseudolabrys sp.]|nr:(Fe-S)-binding protein [Pseudolabrys sp.]